MRGRVIYDAAIETRTFLFTDIEGSTALLRRLGDDAYAALLAEHHRVIRAALAAHEGHEYDTQGDSFFITFNSTSSCVAAAIDAQRLLSEHAWPNDEKVLVRMGIHTGEATERETGLVGYEVHRAARLAAVAHGGQILLSGAAAVLVEDALPREIALRNLGSHRLKDLGRPETIFQLVVPGLPDEFPGLRSLDSPDVANNLPSSLTPFIGRTDDVAQLRELVSRCSLITLTGAGGAGKTRLALQLAADLFERGPDGVWFVTLASVRDPEAVSLTVVESLGLASASTTQTEQMERSLVHRLKPQSVVLVLDNCEHVVGAVARLADSIRRECPNVLIIATSREPLGVEGEEIYRVRSLTLPTGEVEGVNDLSGCESVELFISRARSHDKSYRLDDETAPEVASICRRLDGIPLAIELAAARLSTMSVNDLSRRLDQRFKLLTGGARSAMPRQQTLGATVAWSYDLLSVEEQDFLRRLTVFVGGFDLEAAEAVGATDRALANDVADRLGSLVNKSLVVAERDSGSLRYWMLETIRQFAVEQSVQTDGAGLVMAVRARHAAYYLELCESARSKIWGGAEQVHWVRRLDIEWDNIYAAFAYYAEEEGGVSPLIRLGIATERVLATRPNTAPYDLMATVLTSGVVLEPRVRLGGIIVVCEAWSSTFRSEDESSRKMLGDLFEEGFALATGLADEFAQTRLLLIRAFRRALASDQGGDESLEEDLVDRARAVGDLVLIGFALLVRGVSAAQRRSDDVADAAMSESMESYRRAGDSIGVSTAQVFYITAHMRREGDFQPLIPYIDEAIAVSESVGSLAAMWLLRWQLGYAALVAGDVETAERECRVGLQIQRRLGHEPWAFVFAIFVLACTADLRGNFVAAARLRGATATMADQLPPGTGYRWTNDEYVLLEKMEANLVSELGERTYGQERAVGSALAFDDVCRLALTYQHSG